MQEKCFTDNKHVSHRNHWNRNGLRFNYYERKNYKKIWQFNIVSMYTLAKDVIRVRNKNKGKWERNKKINSRNNVEESSFEHNDLSSNN